MNSRSGPTTVIDMREIDDKAGDVARFLAADPELDARLPEIEERVIHHFGPGTRLEREVFRPYDEEDAAEQFHLNVITDLSLDERVDRLRAVLREEDELLTPVRPQLTIGIL